MIYRIFQFIGQMGILACLFAGLGSLCMWCEGNLSTLSFLCSASLFLVGMYALFWLCFPEERPQHSPVAHKRSASYRTHQKNSAA